MANCIDDNDNEFFDASEDIAVGSDSDSSNHDKFMPNSGSGISTWVPNSSPFDLWIQNPTSIQERRSKFFGWLGLSVDKTSIGVSVDSSDSDGEIDRITWNSGAVLRSPSSCCSFSSSRSLWSCCSSDKLSRGLSSTENFVCRIGNSDSGKAESEGGEHAQEHRIGEDGEMGGPDGVLLMEQLENSSGSSPSGGEAMKGDNTDGSNFLGPMKSFKKWWVTKFRNFSCIMEREDEYHDTDSVLRLGFRRVKVHHFRKQSKELSALYIGQDFAAHKGPILTMKFSPDGQYLATAGEDGIVRLWKVMEDERSDELGIPEIDPSCIYFTMNHQSELKPMCTEKDKLAKSSSLRKTSDSACVVIPPKVFRILEKPLQEFRGHRGEILDISWSKNNRLLSSSVDRTVRLWQVGCDNCLMVFSHNNYVTCVQFNPVDDNYFISGSIDGKVRIWEISGCQVVNWTDIKDIVTAVCYRPDGKGGIVGSLTGYCRFYNISDIQLQLEAQICLHNKKKSSCKRITGFQYFPQDPSKVMVTCADSRIRILQGVNVIGKCKCLRSGGNCLSASLTFDGKHIVSACEDSNVYLWNCGDQGDQDQSQARKFRSSERFPTNASVAIPWYGLQGGNVGNAWQINGSNEGISSSLPLPSPACFLSSQEFFLESYPKGSATWPEEKLPASNHLGLILNSKVRIQVSEDLLSEHVKFPCLGSRYCDCWMGWTNQIIPQLWITSTLISQIHLISALILLGFCKITSSSTREKNLFLVVSIIVLKNSSMTC
ncbi:hypothetical protein Nepgr_010713 [Nepenthes gracilis]|uniref:WD repeat-containing protein 44 n=1 Tax=Nepenthes gracilis TaxID=150966 RepID=A0AAD3SCX8_NEPGR|nr:hypothetical protein Nepgr_010713 [Nepenthes gracilis]